ncbi:MAG: tyrosine-type recombinase/integrase [Pseudolabrys sp.]
MTKIRLAYVQEFIRHGIVRRYFRKAGCKRVTLPGVPGSPEFNAAYESALASLPKPVTETQGSITALVAAYYKSDAFTKALAPETQRMRRNILDRLRERHGDKRVRTLERRHIVMMLEKKAPYAQKNWLKTIRGLMLFAIKENYRADDPTAGVNAARPVVKSHGHMTWGEEQIAAYRDRHPIGTMARLAIELVLNIAARRGDAHQLGAQHIRRGRIEWRPSKTLRKTGKQLQIQILPTLQAALDAMPTKDTSLAFLLNDYGRPFASAAAFGNKFADWCKQAGLEPVTCPDGRVRSYRIHGLRKAACTALAHAGCTGPQIMAISGHSSLAQVQVYIEEAEQERMADAAIKKLRARS